jgi:hypothetical protein
MCSTVVEKLATPSYRYRNIQVLHSLPNRIIIHIRPSPLCDAVVPIRDRRPREG